MDHWMGVMFQRKEDCSRRKQNRVETHQPLQTMPAPPITFPGQEERLKLRDYLEGTAQDTSICPKDVPLSLQHFL